jgi:glyoxylase-like metal-dependent hydrolase (beta-lactamase superfamily II)
MLISGGMSYLVPDLLEQFSSFGIDETHIKKLLILHSHFDHVGTVPFVKRRNPDITIYASVRGWGVLSLPKAVETINTFSRDVAAKMGRESIYEDYDVDWRDDITGEPVAEGDTIRVGETEVRIMETPGHSSCSISAYVPSIKALFASDGGGIPYKDTILTIGNSNVTAFQKSIERMSVLDLDYVCADHYGYVAGDEAHSFMNETVRLGKEFRGWMEEAYRRTGDIDLAVKELNQAFYEANEDFILTREIMEIILQQMVSSIAADMDKN